MKKFYEAIETLVLPVIVITFLILFVCRVIVVQGDSMNNTLLSGEKVITTNFFYKAEKGDIVVTDGRIHDGKPLIKRVIATGGDTIKIDYSTGDVYVNGDCLEENYIKEKIDTDEHRNDIEMTIPEGYLFLMGDNRNNSLDSRSSEIGIVNEKEILGKAIFRITPISRIGFIK